MPGRWISILSVAVAVAMLTGLHSVPHHHHGDSVCFVHLCCDGTHADADAEHAHHHHAGHTEHGECVIESGHLFAFEDSEIKIKPASQYVTNPHAPLLPASCLAAEIMPLYRARCVASTGEYRDWYACLYQSVDAGRTHGLRAPPHPRS